MIDWIVRGRFRLHALLLCYFAIHVVVRWCMSDSLSYDESEQAFLTQWNSLGYNSQPPLYTWIQSGLFQALGYSVLPMAILKNSLLLLTYVLVFGFVLHATENRRAAVLASLGMLTIPQIAWESHRDLSHTVSVTCATAFLLYCVIRLVRQRSTRWYVILGIATGLGVMSKYNFTLTVVAILVAAATIPNCRRSLVDVRMLISVAIAALIIGPHAIWVMSHPQLASSKTISQLTSAAPTTWFERVSQGGIDLAFSTLGCSVLTICVFSLCYRNAVVTFFRQRSERPLPVNQVSEVDALRLVERFLAGIAVVLLVLVFSGGAVNIKTHWLHPFIFLLPTYLALKFYRVASSERRPANQICVICALLACTVIVATIAKPMSAGLRGRYSWLNIPYHELASVVEQEIGCPPSAVFAADTRTAGNLRLQLPHSAVLAQDSGHLHLRIEGRQPAPETPSGARLVSSRVVPGSANHPSPAVAITDSQDPAHRARLAAFAARRMGLPLTAVPIWRTVSFPFRYGRMGDEKEFHFAIIGQAKAKAPDHDIPTRAPRIASGGEWNGQGSQ